MATATAWNGFKESEKNRIPSQVLYKTLFGETEADEIRNREALIKGITILKVEERLRQLLNKQTTQKCIDIVTRTVWNTFYDQV